MKFILIRSQIPLLVFILFSVPLLAEETAARTWKMKNGGIMTAIGVSANFGGIIAKSHQGPKQAFIPYKNLDPSEIAYAVTNLPIVMGDSEKFKLQGKSVSSTRDNYKVVTGYAVSFPTTTHSSSTSGNSTTNTSGGVREITRPAAKSSKLVELGLSSISNGFAVWVDFVAIANGREGKSVKHYSTGIYYFKETGDVSLFDLPPMDDYLGWAFVFRSIETGKILGSSASSQPLQNYAEAFVTEKGGSAKQTTDETRKLILEAIAKD